MRLTRKSMMCSKLHHQPFPLRLDGVHPCHSTRYLTGSWRPTVDLRLTQVGRTLPPSSPPTIPRTLLISFSSNMRTTKKSQLSLTWSAPTNSSWWMSSTSWLDAASINGTWRIGIENPNLTKLGSSYALSSKRHTNVAYSWEQWPPTKADTPHETILLD